MKKLVVLAVLFLQVHFLAAMQEAVTAEIFTMNTLNQDYVDSDLRWGFFDQVPEEGEQGDRCFVAFSPAGWLIELLVIGYDRIIFPLVSNTGIVVSQESPLRELGYVARLACGHIMIGSASNLTQLETIRCSICDNQEIVGQVQVGLGSDPSVENDGTEI